MSTYYIYPAKILLEYQANPHLILDCLKEINKKFLINDLIGKNSEGWSGLHILMHYQNDHELIKFCLNIITIKHIIDAIENRPNSLTSEFMVDKIQQCDASLAKKIKNYKSIIDNKDDEKETENEVTTSNHIYIGTAFRKPAENVFWSVASTEFTKKKELGRGNFGVVHLGHYRHNEAAIKTLLISNYSESALKEFKQEVSCMSQLRSPNIVNFYGVCLEKPYAIIMEYVPQGSLYAILPSNEAKSWGWAVKYRIALDISSGLEYLHDCNMMHRDLKSPNVLLDHQYRAKITDFGLSKVKQETSIKSTVHMVGSLLWMAPELFEGKEASQASDIFSLAIILLELVTHERPWKSAPNPSMVGFYLLQKKREVIPKDCPKNLAALISKC